MLIFYLTIFTAPFTLYLSIRYWREPMSVLPRRRWRFVVAILIALFQLAGWGVLAMFLINKAVS